VMVALIVVGAFREREPEYGGKRSSFPVRYFTRRLRVTERRRGWPASGASRFFSPSGGIASKLSSQPQDAGLGEIE